MNVTANDSKSTPKKAEDATRHPLALLASIKEAVEDVRELVNGMNAPDAQRGMQDSAFDTLGFTLCDLENLESALRAQAEADRGLEVGWAGRVRLDWDDFSAFSKVLFFALHSTHSSRARLQNFTDLTDDQLQQLVRLCEDYEQRAAAQAQAGAGSVFALSGSEQNPDQGGEAL